MVLKPLGGGTNEKLGGPPPKKKMEVKRGVFEK